MAVIEDGIFKSNFLISEIAQGIYFYCNKSNSFKEYFFNYEFKSCFENFNLVLYSNKIELCEFEIVKVEDFFSYILININELLEETLKIYDVVLFNNEAKNYKRVCLHYDIHTINNQKYVIIKLLQGAASNINILFLNNIYGEISHNHKTYLNAAVKFLKNFNENYINKSEISSSQVFGAATDSVDILKSIDLINNFEFKDQLNYYDAICREIYYCYKDVCEFRFFQKQIMQEFQFEYFDYEIEKLIEKSFKFYKKELNNLSQRKIYKNLEQIIEKLDFKIEMAAELKNKSFQFAKYELLKIFSSIYSFIVYKIDFENLRKIDLTLKLDLESTSSEYQVLEIVFSSNAITPITEFEFSKLINKIGVFDVNSCNYNARESLESFYNLKLMGGKLELMNIDSGQSNSIKMSVIL